MFPIKNTTLEKDFFCRPAELVAPDLLGCQLIKRESAKGLLKGIIVETEAYSQEEASCHGHKSRTPRNSTLFGDPGRFYVYLTFGIYHCVNVVTGQKNYANGVLIRAAYIPHENERIAAGPGLLAKRFGINKTHDNLVISLESNLWIAKGFNEKEFGDIIQTTRIGISKAKHLPWRWYIKKSRSISQRMKGDFLPAKEKCWEPSLEEKL